MRSPRTLLSIGSILLLCLSGCSGSQAPRPAHVVIPTPSHSDFGTLRVHYNVLPTLAMNQSVASSYGVARNADQALLVVALRQLQDGDEAPADGSIMATASDLSGRQQQIALRPIQTGAYTDYVGAVRISDHDTLRFKLQVQSHENRGAVQFERNF